MPVRVSPKATPKRTCFQLTSMYRKGAIPSADSVSAAMVTAPRAVRTSCPRPSVRSSSYAGAKTFLLRPARCSCSSSAYHILMCTAVQVRFRMRNMSAQHPRHNSTAMASHRWLCRSRAAGSSSTHTCTDSSWDVTPCTQILYTGLCYAMLASAACLCSKCFKVET